MQPIIASASTRLKHFRDGECRVLSLSVLQLTLRVPEAQARCPRHEEVTVHRNEPLPVCERPCLAHLVD